MAQSQSSVLQRLRKPALSTNRGHQEKGACPSCDAPVLPHSPKERGTKAVTQIMYPEKPATICIHVNQ